MRSTQFHDIDTTDNNQEPETEFRHYRLSDEFDEPPSIDPQHIDLDPELFEDDEIDDDIEDDDEIEEDEEGLN